MINSNHLVKKLFAKELEQRCKAYYASFPSNEQFARDMYRTSSYRLKVSRETVRKWLKGENFPDLEHLLHLIEWLQLDMSKVFSFKNNNITSKNLTEDDIQALSSDLFKKISPEQIELMVNILNLIKTKIPHPTHHLRDSEKRFR